MIRVHKDYVIDADEMCYTVKIDKHKTYTDKNGRVSHVYDIKGYYNSLESALLGVKRDMTRSALSETDEVSINEAIKIIRKINDDFTKQFRSSAYGI